MNTASVSVCRHLSVWLAWLAWLVGVVGLAACGSGPAAAPALSGAAVLAASQGTPPAAVWTEAMEARRLALAEALADAGVEVLRGAGSTLLLRWSADRAFDANSERPSALAVQVWDRVAAALREGPTRQARIQGHGDDEALAAQRALQVRDELVRRGLPAASLEVEAWGGRVPLVPAGSADVAARNRRIELVVLGR